MAFRKRNIGLSSGAPRASESSSASQPSIISVQPPGTRSSPLDGRPTTSTGTPSLDNLLAGHAGLPLGNSLLIEESGTTDFAGALLRYYAAEGVVQEHVVHVVGVGQQWGRGLPGLIGAGEGKEKGIRAGAEKMKIAWRYERLGEFGAVAGARGGSNTLPFLDSIEVDPKDDTSTLKYRIADSSVDKPSSPSPIDPSYTPPAFCHSFDLTKRLTHAGLSIINYIPLPPSHLDSSPYANIVQILATQLSTSSATTPHRLVIPSLLSPALYPPQASHPTHLLQFLHALRALLSTYSTRLTAMITLPSSLYPRSSGLVRWVELLSDGVLELVPFPHSSAIGSANSTSGAATSQEEPPQGMLKVHRLPIFHDRGGGSIEGMTEDWAFTLSRRKFAIKPFSLPPVGGDNEAQKGNVAQVKNKAADMEF